jgi:3-hydroxyisobutyrate dehydrogenase-like beta-hydroxyacid dehydrogenase
VDALVSAADVVLVVTPPGAAVDAATALAAAASSTGSRPLIADLNATAPPTAARIEAIYASVGLDFVDGSISGAPPTLRPGARVYLAGPRASEIADLPWRHVTTIDLGTGTGAASALKMCTASVYKGLVGLVMQAMRTADHYGVLDPVLADLKGAGLDHVASVAVAASKAERYVPEMREIATAQQGAGLTRALFDAFADVYHGVVGSELAGADPETIDLTMPAAEVLRKLQC